MRFIYIFILLIPLSVSAQMKEQISLKEAYELYEKRYPSLKDTELLKSIYQKEIQLLENSRMPTIFLKADARFQSESIGFPTEDGVVIPFEIDIPLYAAKSYVEASYNIYDGGYFEAQQNYKEAQLKANQQAVEIERYNLKKRVNQLCINIQLLREQSKLLEISNKNLEARKESIIAGVEFGILLESELSKLEVKELELQALQEDIRLRQNGLVDVLSHILGVPLSHSIQITFPELPIYTDTPTLSRPELKLFSLQKEALLAKSDIIEVKNRPRLDAFAQAGIGIPDPLNFFDNELSPYGLVGLSFNWRLTDWKRSQKERELLSLQALKIQHAKESFEFNIHSKEPEYTSEINRLSKQIEYDLKIAQMQQKILQIISAQLDEGVVTSTEYIIQLNAELKARQNLIIHQTKMFKEQLEYWNLQGVL